MYGSSSRFLVIILTLAVSVVAADSVPAGVPSKINYQGRLTDSVTGEPETGIHSMVFRIYDASVAGTLLWSESQALRADSAGVFSAILGSITPIDLSFDGPVWLEMEVGGETMSPRRELVSVPFAFRADLAEYSENADSLGGYGAAVFVREGETSVITSEMISDGPGSGLDADMVDGLNANAFADSGHVHDDRYYTQDSLSSPGTVNEGANPIDWTKLKNVPAGFADGADDLGGAGDGHSLDAVDGDPVNAVFVDADGQVGVGTLTPERKIHLLGDNPRVLIDASTSNPEINFRNAGDAYADMWALYKDDSTDDLRFFQAGDKITFQNVTGNVGIGTDSPGSKLDVGGEISTAAHYRIAGETVLATPGEYNTHIGVGTGAASTGHRNTFVGDLAGRDNTAGSRNVFVGHLAGLNNTTGGHNVFMGRSAGKANEDGESNTYIGTDAGSSTVDAMSNTIVGGHAGWKNDMGGFNTMIGAGAGAEATGYGNTFVGNAAGYHNEGDSNVFLGSFAGYDETGSDKLYIANGSDTSDVLIYGDFASRRVGIGVLDPSATLTLNDNIQGTTIFHPGIVIGNPGGSAQVTMGSDLLNYGTLAWSNPDGISVGSTGWVHILAGANALNCIRLTGDGDVGLGTPFPAEKLHVVGDNPRILIEAASSNPEINFKSTGDPPAEVWALYKESSNDDLYFLQDGTIRVALKNGTSAVGIGTNNVGTYELYVQGEAYATGGWTPSDLRFKEEIGGIESPLEKVLGLRGVRFKWKTEEYGDRGLPEGDHFGVIAQEAEEILPEIVKEGPDGELAVAYAEIIPVLIESVRELKTENDALKDRIAALEAILD